MIIRDLKTQKEFFKQVKTPIFGAGVYAFDRLGPEKIIDNYRILCLRYTLDSQIIEEEIETFSLEKGMGTKHIREPRNATTVLKLPLTKKYLDKFENPAIIVLKASSKMEKICQENGWRLIANSTSFGKKMFENKVNFRRISEQIKLAVPPGGIVPVDKLNYEHSLEKHGLPFVVQHPTKGGGKGTFFINSRDDFDKAVKKLEGKWKPKGESENEEEVKYEMVTEAIVVQYIRGPSPSITGCVTKHGVLSTNLQYQVIDAPELYNSERGSGLFCGHDWTSSRFTEEINRQAYQSVEKIGRYFKKMGYRGIFGIDFVLDEKSKKLYVIECNSRLLGSFPTINMVQSLNNEPLIIGFHILEFLNIDCQIDVGQVNSLMRQNNKIGAQIIPHNLTNRWTRNHKQIKAGVFKLKKDRLEYLRPGYDLKHLKDKKEFVLTDGIQIKNSPFSPNRRLGRVLTLERVLDDSGRELNPWAKQIAIAMHQALDLKPVKLLKLKKVFNPHLLAKG
jgi:predicted ATP-grasp superfamily ATP-dependent carboligase